MKGSGPAPLHVCSNTRQQKRRGFFLERLVYRTLFQNIPIPRLGRVMPYFSPSRQCPAQQRGAPPVQNQVPRQPASRLSLHQSWLSQELDFPAGFPSEKSWKAFDCSAICTPAFPKLLREMGAHDGWSIKGDG